LRLAENSSSFLKIRYSMASVQEIILIFTKYPLPGQCKTRLIPALGAEKAADLQREMTRTIVDTVESYIQGQPTALEIYHEGGSRTSMRSWLGGEHIYKRQSRGDLGQRMHAAIAGHLGCYQSVILIGSDCPSVSGAHLAAGFTALKQGDIVVGPAHDGGYYLIGIGKSISAEALASVFTDIPWGGPEVLERTLERIARLKLNCHLLPKLHDIYTPDDLKYLHNHSDA